MSPVNEKNWIILSDASLWNVPVPDHFRVEIIKGGSCFFQNKVGHFSALTRQGAKAKGDVRQLSKEWFYKTMFFSELQTRSTAIKEVANMFEAAQTKSLILNYQQLKKSC